MSAMSVQPELSRTRGLLPSLADTDARNSHMSSRLWAAHIVHMMSTVLFVYTRPVKTRAGVITMSAIHPSPSSQIVQAVGRKRSPASAFPNEWNLADAARTSIPVEDRTNMWTILDIPTTHQKTGPVVLHGPREQKQSSTKQKLCKKKKEMSPKSLPRAPWRTTRNKNKECQLMSVDHSSPSSQIVKVRKERHAQHQPPIITEKIHG